MKGKGGFSIESDDSRPSLSVLRWLEGFAKNVLEYHSHFIMERALQYCDAMVETASSHSPLEVKTVKKLGRNLNLGQMTCVILIFTIDCRKPYTNDFIFP